MQNILTINCGKGYFDYKTRDGKNVKLKSTSNKSYDIYSGTVGRFKIVLGFYYYKREEDLNLIDNIENKFYVPASEKIVLFGEIFYKVSGYKIIERVFKCNGDGFSIKQNESCGFILDLDILDLYEHVNPKTSLFDIKSLIYFSVLVKKESVCKRYYGFFTNEKLMNEMAQIKRADNENESFRLLYIIVQFPCKYIEIGEERLFITQEIDKTFVLIHIDKIGKNIPLLYLKIDDFVDSHTQVYYSMEYLKLRIPDHRDILKFKEQKTTNESFKNYQLNEIVKESHNDRLKLNQDYVHEIKLPKNEDMKISFEVSILNENMDNSKKIRIVSKNERLNSSIFEDEVLDVPQESMIYKNLRVSDEILVSDKKKNKKKSGVSTKSKNENLKFKNFKSQSNKILKNETNFYVSEIFMMTDYKNSHKIKLISHKIKLNLVNKNGINFKDAEYLALENFNLDCANNHSDNEEQFGNESMKVDVHKLRNNQISDYGDTHKFVVKMCDDHDILLKCKKTSQKKNVFYNNGEYQLIEILTFSKSHKHILILKNIME